MVQFNASAQSIRKEDRLARMAHAMGLPAPDAIGQAIKDMNARLGLPDGLAAMERFRQHRSEVDLALLDVVMPEQDGRATFEALRAIDPHLPVLFMTGYGAEVLSSEFLARTDVHIIAKPFEARDLVRAVHEALESNVPTSD